MSGRTKVRNMLPKQRAAAMANIRAQHGNRSQRARTMDARQTARQTFGARSDRLYLWQGHPERYDVRSVDTWEDFKERRSREVKPEPVKPAPPKPSVKRDSVKIITNNMPAGYEIRKWSYEDRTGKVTVHAVMFEGEPVFGQNKTFKSLPDARKALKEHHDTQMLLKQVREDRAQLEEKGYIGKPLKKTRKTKKGSDVIGERPTGIVRNHLQKLWVQVHGDEQIGDFDTWLSEQSDKTYPEAKADLLRRGARRTTEMTEGEQARHEREQATHAKEMMAQACDHHIDECYSGDLEDCKIACVECSDEDACMTAGM